MNAMKLGALALALSGGLHFVAVIGAGFAGAALPLLLFGVLFLILAAILYQHEQRLVAWLVFVMMLVIPIIALGQMGPGHPVPAAIVWVILILDWICLASLLVALWQKPQPA